MTVFNPRLGNVMRFGVWLALTVLMMGTACRADSDVPQETLAPSTVVGVESMVFGGVAWPQADRLVVAITRHPDESGPSDQLWQMSPDGSALARLPLVRDPTCLRTQYLSPTPLLGGDVGFVKVCRLDTSKSPIPVEYSLHRYDMATGAQSSLVSGSSLGYLNSFTAPVLAVAPSEDGAIVSAGDSMCGSLAWVGQSGLTYPAIEIGEADESWSLDEYFSTESQDCTDQGRAAWPAWSPDGSQIGFFAPPQSIGVQGFARRDWTPLGTCT